MTLRQRDWPVIKNLALLMEAIADVPRIHYSRLYVCGGDECGRDTRQSLAYLDIEISKYADDNMLNNTISAIVNAKKISLWHMAKLRDYTGRNGNLFLIVDVDADNVIAAAEYIRKAAETGVVKTSDGTIGVEYWDE